ncbi:MAG: aminoacyl-tRNA hydrolase [Chloroflexi bacterium]|nr:aminoacyl-tRNA hydrolase [Chloroflexota bacterium]
MSQPVAPDRTSPDDARMPIGGRFGQFRQKIASRAEPEAPAADADLTRPLVVFGLGNPEARYEGTRHNVGAWTIAEIARRYHVQPRREGRVNVARIEIDGHTLHIAQPRSYMNESGGPIAQEARRLGAHPQQVLVVYDELDLPAGATRMRLQGSSGGNNGMKSIIGALGSQEFARIRIGIDRPYDRGAPVRDPERIAAWVLSRPSPGDRQLLEAAIDRVIAAIEESVRDGYGSAMSRLNASPRAPGSVDPRDPAEA